MRNSQHCSYSSTRCVCVRACTLPIPVKPLSQPRWWTDLSSTSFYFLLPQLRSPGSLWSACCVAQTTLENKWFSCLTSSCWDYMSVTITSSTVFSFTHFTSEKLATYKATKILFRKFHKCVLYIWAYDQLSLLFVGHRSLCSQTCSREPGNK